MSYRQDLLRSLHMNETDVIRNMIHKCPIIYYGIVDSIPEKDGEPVEGVVNVIPSVISREDDMFIITCVLAGTASSSVAVKSVPHVGDKVLVFSPVNYKNTMFSKERRNTTVSKDSYGYSIFTGIAVLINQLNVTDHKNTIVFDSGKIEAKLAYDEENDVNHLILNTGADGSIDLKLSYSSDDSDYITKVSADASGNINCSNTKASVSISSDGVMTLSNENTTLTIGSDGNVSIQTKGKFTFKNDTTDLKTSLSELMSIIKSLKTFGSPAQHQLLPDSVNALTNWESNYLDTLLS